MIAGYITHGHLVMFYDLGCSPYRVLASYTHKKDSWSFSQTSDIVLSNMGWTNISVSRYIWPIPILIYPPKDQLSAKYWYQYR